MATATKQTRKGRGEAEAALEAITAMRHKAMAEKLGDILAFAGLLREWLAEWAVAGWCPEQMAGLWTQGELSDGTPEEQAREYAPAVVAFYLDLKAALDTLKSQAPDVALKSAASARSDLDDYIRDRD